MASRNETRKELVKPTSNSVLVRANKPVFRATASYQSLVAENKKLKEEQGISLAANKKMEDQIIGLTKRNEELTAANINLAEALATEQTTSTRLINLNENTKSLVSELTRYVESQKLGVHASFAEMLTNIKKSLLPETQCVEIKNIKSLQDWTVVRTQEDYFSWHLKLTTEAKQKEMAKYLEENISEETLRDAIIESMKLMFSKTFFVKDISFRDEKGRVYFKTSNLLKSMQIYLATKFREEATTKKIIQKKIRNFKDALSKNPDLWIEAPEITESNTVANNDNLESSGQNDSGSSSDQSLTYCLCKRPDFGRMILCDNDVCPIKWYHFPCVSLETKPKGKWYCPNCRGAGVEAKSSKSGENRNK